MDNGRLSWLRGEMKRGHITVQELKNIVVRECQNKPRVSIRHALGRELELIRDKGLRDFLYRVLGELPRYFWHVPASVSGFHDIGRDNMLGGLIQHTRKVARVARVMCEPYGLAHRADDFVAAGLLHDALKYGWDGHLPREHDHATFTAAWLEARNYFADRAEIRHMIRAHLGRWGRVLPKSDMQWAFHLADYVVARGAVPPMGILPIARRC